MEDRRRRGQARRARPSPIFFPGRILLSRCAPRASIGVDRFSLNGYVCRSVRCSARARTLRRGRPRAGRTRAKRAKRRSRESCARGPEHLSRFETTRSSRDTRRARNRRLGTTLRQLSSSRNPCRRRRRRTAAWRTSRRPSCTPRARAPSASRIAPPTLPPRGRRTVVPDDADDAPRFPAPPGMGGERWDARYRRHASVTSPSLERKDVPGPPMMAKVTARCYEVDLRGERDHTARPRRARDAAPATPGRGARAPTQSHRRRTSRGPGHGGAHRRPRHRRSPPQIARDEPLRSNLEREPAPAPEPEPATPVPSSPSSSRAPEKPLYPTKKSTSSAPGVQFVWTEASSAKQKADAPSETDAPSSAPASAPSSRSSPSSSETPARSRSRSRSPSPSRSRDASNASRSSGSRSPSPRRRSRRSTSPGRSRDVSSSKGSDASFASRGWRGAANALGSGMLRASPGVSAARRVASDGASRAREGVGRAGDHLRRARDVVGSIPVRQVCLTRAARSSRTRGYVGTFARPRD